MALRQTLLRGALHPIPVSAPSFVDLFHTGLLSSIYFESPPFRIASSSLPLFPASLLSLLRPSTSTPALYRSFLLFPSLPIQRKPSSNADPPTSNQHIIKTTVPTSNYYVALDKRNGNPYLLEQFECTSPSLLPPQLCLFPVATVFSCLHPLHFNSQLTTNMTLPLRARHHRLRPLPQRKRRYAVLLSLCSPAHSTPPSPSPAFKFRAWLGGERKINEYCRDVALKVGKRLAEILGTELMDEDGSQTLNMVCFSPSSFHCHLSVVFLLSAIPSHSNHPCNADVPPL